MIICENFSTIATHHRERVYIVNRHNEFNQPVI